MGGKEGEERRGGKVRGEEGKGGKVRAKKRR